MTFDAMDIEDFGRHWRRARRRLVLLSAEKQRLIAAGLELTAEFLERWDLAQAEFEAAAERWDAAHRAGVVIVVDDSLADAAEARADELYERVVSAPLEDAPRLAYADAVEAADPERAEFIRLQITLARYRRERRTCEPPAQYNREEMLIRNRGAHWAADFASLVSGWQYLRGFADVVKIDAALFLATAPELYRRLPVLHLNLTGVLPVAGDLFGSVHLRRIKSISMIAEKLRDQEAIAIARSAHLAGLEWLDLQNNRIGRPGLEALAASEQMPRLGFLGFAGNAAEDPTPRHADGYDGDSFIATELQRRYGPRDWLSARERVVWPPQRDAVWDAAG